MIAVERGAFEVVKLSTKKARGMTSAFNHEVQETIYDRYGLIVVFIDTKLRCKVCHLEFDGYKARSHTQETAHLNVWHSQHSKIISANLVLGSWCDGCPMLMYEKHPYLDQTDQVCRLGFYHEEEDVLGIKFNYVIDDELWRPEKCKWRCVRIVDERDKSDV